MKTGNRLVWVQRIRAGFSILVVWLLAAADASATIHTLVADMNGAQEVPAVPTAGTGTCTVTLNDVTRQVTVTGTYQNLTGTANLAHIHGPAPIGMIAGVLVNLTQTGGMSGTLGGGGTLATNQHVLDMLNGLHYCNLHSSFAGGGEIRGQIVQPSEARSLRASRGAGTSVGVTYAPACGATDHVAYWGQAGPGMIVGPLSWIGSACGLGTTGSATYDPGAVGASQFFYSVVVGQNATFQGSFGRGTSGAERPEAVGVGLCDQAQRLNVICPP